MAVAKSEIMDAIANMTVLELSQLIKDMEEKFGVSAAAAVAELDNSVAISTANFLSIRPSKRPNTILAIDHILFNGKIWGVVSARNSFNAEV